MSAVRVKAVLAMPSGAKIRSLHHLAQPLAGDAFDHLAGPVDVAAIFPIVAGIEQERRPERRLRGGDDAGLAVLLGQAVVLLVEEVVAEAGGVQEQHAGGDGALGRPQPGLAGGVEALQDLGLADLGRVFLGRGVEVELAVLDQLQAGGAGDRLGGREDREHRIGGHRGVLAEQALAGGALVDVAAAVGRHGDHARHARGSSDGALQDRVAGSLQAVGHVVASRIGRGRRRAAMACRIA